MIVPTESRWSRFLPWALCGTTGLVALGGVGVALLRQSKPSEAVLAVEPVRKLAFAESPSLATAEPPCDRALVARVQALAESKPEQASPALKEIVKGTRDQAALTVAASVANKLPAEKYSTA